MRVEVRRVRQVREALEKDVPDRFSCHMDSMWPSLSYSNKTPVASSIDSWSQVTPKEVVIQAIGDGDPPGRSVIYKWALVIPE